MKALGMVMICLFLSGSVLAQQKKAEKKKTKLIMNPKKDLRNGKPYTHLAGKNQNDILRNYAVKNILLFGGKRLGRGNGGRIIDELEKGFLDLYQDEKNDQWVEKKRKLLTSYDVPGLSHVWDWEEGDGINSASSRSCSEVCPDSLEILSLNNEKFLRKQEHFLSFRNRESDMMDSYKKLYGYCWGHASLSSSLKMFTFFDPKNKAGADVPPETDTKAWTRFYGKIMRKLSHNAPQVIPYFSSIHEFSSHPLLKDDFKKMVAQRWGRLAVRVSNYKAIEDMYLAAPTYEELVETFEILKMKVATLQAPRINFHRFGAKAYSHVATVIGVEQFKNGMYRIYTEDPNDYPNKIPMYKRYIEIRKNPIKRKGKNIHANYNFFDVDNRGLGRGHWKAQIGKIKILDESDAFHEHSVSRLHKFCVKQSGCQK